MKFYLEQLHSLDIVHGDLLKNNIIIQFKEDDIPILKIIDFGNSISLDLYKYYYTQEIRHKIIPNEETYKVFDLLNEAIKDIMDKKSEL